ncbi:cuticle protein AMP4 [Procambarus clarkii]|uniref:cuticle protein AMP4 n=1 Tax=Procambarus clarkii TaxID=6728 RepID=UPI001E675772|nr:cuticle protein AMP4-like isoform X3 [Procambarus clarkii]
MKLILMVALTAVAVADKLPETVPVVAILRSQQVNPDELGAHSSDFEADNGIKVQLSGSEGAAGGSNMAGSWSYPQEDGSIASVKFVADENGFQPESDLLPVAPEFPHPIPQFVLDQIAFAEEERKRKAQEEA